MNKEIISTAVPIFYLRLIHARLLCFSMETPQCTRNRTDTLSDLYQHGYELVPFGAKGRNNVRSRSNGCAER